MQQVLNKEKHSQEVERMKLQNKISEEQIAYLKDMERRLKAMVIEWRRATDKDKVVKMIHALLFNQKEKMVTEKFQKKLNEKFIEISGEIQLGDKVKMKQNRQVGIVKEIRGKKVIVQLGAIPLTVNMEDLRLVKEKDIPEETA